MFGCLRGVVDIALHAKNRSWSGMGDVPCSRASTCVYVCGVLLLILEFSCTHSFRYSSAYFNSWRVSCGWLCGALLGGDVTSFTSVAFLVSMLVVGAALKNLNLGFILICVDVSQRNSSSVVWIVSHDVEVLVAFWRVAVDNGNSYFWFSLEVLDSLWPLWCWSLWWNSIFFKWILSCSIGLVSFLPFMIFSSEFDVGFLWYCCRLIQIGWRFPLGISSPHAGVFLFPCGTRVPVHRHQLWVGVVHSALALCRAPMWLNKMG